MEDTKAQGPWCMVGKAVAASLECKLQAGKLVGDSVEQSLKDKNGLGAKVLEVGRKQ